MKKTILLFALGFTAHMLYLDLILLEQHRIINNCSSDEAVDANGELPCLKYGNSTADRFYGKYFGLYTLVKWNQVVTGPWRME